MSSTQPAGPGRPAGAAGLRARMGRPLAGLRRALWGVHARQTLLVAAGGACIGMPFVIPEAFVLAWVGFVPLLWAIEGRGLAQSYYFGAVTGVAAWAVGTYWVADFVDIFKGYPAPWNWAAAATIWLWAGQFHGLAALAYRWLQRHTALPAVVLFPPLFVAAESLYPLLFDVKIGEGQSAFLIALQGVDLVGVLGLDALICVAAAVAYMLLRRQWSGIHGAALVCAAIVLALWFGYGYQRLQAWDARIAGWADSRQVGVVQPNDEPTIDIPPPPEGYTRRRPPEMEMSEGLAQRGAELVIWPETRYKGYFASAQVRLAYRRQVEAMGSALLFHDLERVHHENGYNDYNTAVVIGDDGERVGDYRKVKRVAFGEYVPVLSQVPVLRWLVERYFGGFLREITPGEGHATLPAAGMRLVPKICYESAFPAFIADAVGADAAGKVIVIMSNDGWFGRTSQPEGHLRASALRAVENRVPLIHAINNGPSGAVLPSGRILGRSRMFTRDTLLLALPYSPDSGGSFYNRHPRLFIHGVYGVVLALFLWAGFTRRRR